jgi:hypothetical protein
MSLLDGLAHGLFEWPRLAVRELQRGCWVHTGGPQRIPAHHASWNGFNDVVEALLRRGGAPTFTHPPLPALRPRITATMSHGQAHSRRGTASSSIEQH